MNTETDQGPNLLLDWQDHIYAPRLLPAGVGSLAIHGVVLLILVLLLDLPAPVPPPDREVAQVIHRVTPLVAPRFHLTQKDPNRTKPTQELTTETLAPLQATKQSERSRSAPEGKKFRPPAQHPLPAAPKISEPPQIQAQAKAPAILPQAGVINVPPPKIQTKEEPPKLAFETPGQGGAAPAPGHARLEPPKPGVDAAVKSIIRGGGVAELEPAPDLPDSVKNPQLSGGTKILPELLSDPLGVDFKPYVIQVLYLVKRNWLAVYPETAQLGRSGIVTLQFIVDRNGQVPKLVIASTSGTDALDRAAVAGVSASQPLPPFPPEFQGKEIRLQFSFKYNMQ